MTAHARIEVPSLWDQMTTAERSDAAQAGRESGETAAQTAQRLGCSRSAILGQLHRRKQRQGRAAVGVPKERGPQKAPPTGLVIQKDKAFEPIPGIEPVAIMELTPTTCRWPVNGLHGRGGGEIYCGALCDALTPYCEAHTRVAWREKRIEAGEA